jgi:hypothetical protein
MPDFRLPLSGDVVQSINPWSWTWNLGGGQLGLVNINLGRSSDPDLEAQILDEVGSYGRQIGRLGDVLAILLRRLDVSALTPEEADQIEDFQRQIADVERLKARR